MKQLGLRFGVGDRVKYVGDTYAMEAGSLGTVVSIWDWQKYPYRVAFDRYGGSKTYGYIMTEDELEAG